MNEREYGGNGIVLLPLSVTKLVKLFHFIFQLDLNAFYTIL